MATKRVPIVGWASKPDASGNVFFTPYSTVATNDHWDGLIAVYKDASGNIAIHGRFAVPHDYVGSAKAIVVWTSTATSGAIVWTFEYRAVGGNDTTSLDQATAAESVNGTPTAPGAAHRRMETALTLTAGNLAADNTVEFIFWRLSGSGSDTMAADGLLFELLFEYVDV